MHAPKTSPRMLALALCGLPGSGKSSICKALQEQSSSDVRINGVEFDATPYDGSWSATKWHQQRMDTFTTIAEEFTSGLETLSHQSGGSGHCVILCDDNAFYRSMRRSIHSILRSTAAHGPIPCHFAILHVHCPTDVCIARDSARTRGKVGSEVIERMSGMLQPPCAPHSDGSPTWEQPLTLCLDGTQRLDELVLRVRAWLESKGDSSPWSERHLVPGSSDSMMEAAAAERARVQQDVVHQADLGLRKKVAQLMQGRQDKEKAAKELSVRRKSALEAIRTQCHSRYFLTSLHTLHHESHESNGSEHLRTIVEHLVDHAWEQTHPVGSS